MSQTALGLTPFAPLKMHIFPFSCFGGISLRLPESLSGPRRASSQPVMALIFHSDPFCCSEASHRTKHAVQGQSRCPVSTHLHLNLHYSVAPIRFNLQIVFHWGKETVRAVMETSQACGYVRGPAEGSTDPNSHFCYCYNTVWLLTLNLVLTLT